MHMSEKSSFTCLIFLLVMTTAIGSGCIEFTIEDGFIRYESSPTKIQYTIHYGYRINCTGIGKYEINYDCDKPEVLLGMTAIAEVSGNYNDTTVANNNMTSWNVSGDNNHSYELGINATVIAESFLIADLNGEDALQIQEINTTHPELISRYCNEQSNDTTTFIDPNYPEIKVTANNIRNQTNSNNSFILAKSLFVWLKQYTTYQPHENKTGVQPARTTFELKTGDCDDLSFLYISLCRSIDIPARFIRGYLIENNTGIAKAVSHVWVEVFVGENISDNGWIPVECACPSKDLEIQVNQNFGVEDVGHLRLFTDDGSNESISTVTSGLLRIKSSGVQVNATAFVEINDYDILESEKLTVDKDDNRAYE